MRVAVFIAIVLLGLLALALADDTPRQKTKDVQTPAQDRKGILKLGKKLLKMFKKRPPPPPPAPYVPYVPPPSYAPPPSYGPQQSYGPPPYRR